MIHVIAYWVLNGKKHPMPFDQAIINKKELEKLRNEKAIEHGCELTDIVFKYKEEK
jgi:hypothetical protein